MIINECRISELKNISKSIVDGSMTSKVNNNKLQINIKDNKIDNLITVKHQILSFLKTCGKSLYLGLKNNKITFTIEFAFNFLNLSLNLTINFKDSTAWIDINSKSDSYNNLLFLSSYLTVPSYYNQPDVWHGNVKYPKIIVNFDINTEKEKKYNAIAYNNFSNKKSKFDKIETCQNYCLSRITYNTNSVCFDINIENKGPNTNEITDILISRLSLLIKTIFSSKATTPMLNLNLLFFRPEINYIKILKELFNILKTNEKKFFLSIYFYLLPSNESLLMKDDCKLVFKYYFIKIPDFSLLLTLIHCLKKRKKINRKILSKPILMIIGKFLQMLNLQVLEQKEPYIIVDDSVITEHNDVRFYTNTESEFIKNTIFSSIDSLREHTSLIFNQY